MTATSNLAATHHLASVAGIDTAPAVRFGRSPAVRRLHVVDVENLLGSGRPAPAELSWCARTYRGLGVVGPDDLVVVGSNPVIGLEVSLRWRGCRLLVGHGPDGADRALLPVLTHERVEQQFTQVIVASGDGIFADPVAALQRHRVEVTVVSRPPALSARLRLAATHCLAFPPAAPPDLAATA